MGDVEIGKIVGSGAGPILRNNIPEITQKIPKFLKNSLKNSSNFLVFQEFYSKE